MHAESTTFHSALVMRYYPITTYHTPWKIDSEQRENKMMIDALTALRRFTTVVADTGDIDAIQRTQPVDATTNPTLILQVAQEEKYAHLLQDAVAWAVLQSDNPQQRVVDATDRLLVHIAREILQLVPGMVSIEIDARFSYSMQRSINKARRLVTLLQQVGGQEVQQRVLIKLAATWQGIQAAAQLEQEGIRCNLTLLFSLAQARACAEAGVFLISPFVGRISDWYKAHRAEQTARDPKDPGVAFVTQVYRYYKQHQYQTVVMGASFRNIDQILALAGCDKLTIAPSLLQQLAGCYLPVQQQLQSTPLQEKSADFLRPQPLIEEEFYWLHHQDCMAVTKLAEGICQFSAAQERLEQLFTERFTTGKQSANN